MNFAKNNFRDWKTIREIRENFCPRTFLAIRYLTATYLYTYVYIFSSDKELKLVRVAFCNEAAL